MEDADLIIVGAGAKAAAIAAKVHVLNSLGLGPFTLTIIEGNQPAASWLGLNGATSGEEPLAIPAIKDVGFPYQSYDVFGEHGADIDHAMLSFSWQQYLVGRRTYARWVNAGSPQVQHRDYGHYLAWVLSRASAGVTMVSGRATRVSLQTDDQRWVVDVADSSAEPRYRGDALVLTGPGVHRQLPHDPDVVSRMFHCDSSRSELERIPAGESSDVAIVGGGESALSCLVFLRALRPEAYLTVYTPMLPLSRGESFLENRVFSNPDDVDWGALDLQTRRDFIKHSDRGVFDPQTLSTIASDEHCRFVTGRVVHVSCAEGGGGVCVNFGSTEGVGRERHDYLVNCTGFDILTQLRELFEPADRDEIERRTGGFWQRPAGVDVTIGRALEVDGLHPRLHIPALAALSQGPGFANLGCLGLVANRVLEPLTRGRVGEAPPGDGAEALPLADVGPREETREPGKV
jgi:mycobactin lysine-N-oxygenase